MKATLCVAALGGLLASTGPIIVKTVTEVEYVTQTTTVAPTPAPVVQPVFQPVVQSPAQPAVSEKPVFFEQPQLPTPSIAPAPIFSIPQNLYSSPAPAPAPTKPANNNNQYDDYQKMIVGQHNLHRSNHSAPDLVWDATLAGYAENTANFCVFAHDMKQGGGGYGQNLASWGSTGSIDSLKNKVAAMGVTDQWYNSEVLSWQFYGLDNPPVSSDLHAWGHFTQLVWKSSTKVGCATVKCGAGTVLPYASWYTVCNYNPPGNFGGKYGANVLPTKGGQVATISLGV